MAAAVTRRAPRTTVPRWWCVELFLVARAAARLARRRGKPLDPSERWMLSTHAAVAVTCLVLGWLAGNGYARAAMAWSTYRTRRAELPVLLRLARHLSAKAAGWVLLAALVAVLAVYALATKGS